MYYLQQGSFAVHILGLIFWIGGLITLTRILRVFTLGGEGSVLEGREEIHKACNAIWKGFVLGGLVVVLITGVVQLSTVGIPYYMKQGWFHMKLTAVIVLLVVTAMAGMQMTKLSRGEVLKRGKLAAIHGMASALTLVILLITYLGRGIG